MSFDSNTSSDSSMGYTLWQKELLPHIHPYHHEHAASQYHHLATDADIKTFLEQEPLWDNVTKQWTSVLKAASIDDLRTALRDVVDTIIRKLGKAPEHVHVTREIHLTVGNHLEHVERYPCTGGTSPHMVVKGTGPSFQDPLRASGGDRLALAFSNTVTFFEISRDDELCSDDTVQVEESALYARQIFIQQPNRRFVRSLLLSEEWCQLFHYGRTGAQYTPPFHIHEDVTTFIRIVLGVSSYDEHVLGLDTAVQWSIEDGRKTGGTIILTDVTGAQTQYVLCDVEPAFRRFDFMGRGTTGWRVRSPEGAELFVKDLWRPEEDQPEYAILQDLVGVDGVPHMVAYEVRGETTALLRANGDASYRAAKLSNRVFTRMVMERCGNSIASFQSQRQLVCAMRDAIAAHQILVNKHDVLHRDISPNNILLGGKAARIGERGKLIDFDMAFRGPRPLGQTPEDPKAGTLFYTSVSMLRSRTGTRPHTPFHDQLDDLESFYYVLYDLMFTWAAVGIPVQEAASHARCWKVDSLSLCALYKRGLFLENPKVEQLSPFWLPPTAELLIAFHAIARELVSEKNKVIYMDDAEVVQKYQTLLTRADDFYAKILALFDKAIDALEKEENGNTSPPSHSGLDPPPRPSSSTHTSGSQNNIARQPVATVPASASLSTSGADVRKDDTSTLKGACSSAVKLDDSLAPTSSTAAEGVQISNSGIAVGSPACVSPTSQPATPPNPRKRSAPMDFDDGVCLKGKRVQLNTSNITSSRRSGWIRTSPHRTRAWVKANTHLL